MRIFGKGECKLIANFSATMVTSLPSISLSLSLSLSLCISLSLSHRAHLSHNIWSASALPIIIKNVNLDWLLASQSSVKFTQSHLHLLFLENKMKRALTHVNLTLSNKQLSDDEQCAWPTFRRMADLCGESQRPGLEVGQSKKRKNLQRQTTSAQDIDWCFSVRVWKGSLARKVLCGATAVLHWSASVSRIWWARSVDGDVLASQKRAKKKQLCGGAHGECLLCWFY